MRDPNRISPYRSPRATRSPSVSQQTMRRATYPATCTHSTRCPASVSNSAATCSFASVASGRLATRNLPGLYATAFTSPAHGVRLMCTSSGLRKMLTRTARALRNRGSSAAATASTRPSPGETTRLAPSGTRRRGLRKNHPVKSTTAPNNDPATVQPNAHAAAAGTPASARKGSPSRAIGQPRARSAIDQFLVLSTSWSFLSQGIMARNRAPTSSIGCCSPRLSKALYWGRLAWHSRIHSLANHPLWISSRMRFISCLVSSVMMHGQQARHAAALRELRAHEVPRSLGGDHEHVDRGRRHDLAEMDVEPVPEGQIGVLLHVRANFGAIDARLHLIRRQDHHHIGPLHGISHRHDFKSGPLRLLPRRALPEADEHVHAAVLQVQRVRVALAAEPDDRDRLPLQTFQIGVFIVVDL